MFFYAKSLTLHAFQPQKSARNRSILPSWIALAIGNISLRCSVSACSACSPSSNGLVKGTKSGKLIGRPSIPEGQRDAIRAAYARKEGGYRTLAKRFGVAVMTVRKCVEMLP
jgi:hypothetical protein